MLRVTNPSESKLGPQRQFKAPRLATRKLREKVNAAVGDVHLDRDVCVHATKVQRARLFVAFGPAFDQNELVDLT